jgi:hypothetical protein
LEERVLYGNRCYITTILIVFKRGRRQ